MAMHRWACSLGRAGGAGMRRHCSSTALAPHLARLRSQPQPLLRRLAALDHIHCEYSQLEDEYLARQRALQVELRTKMAVLFAARQGVVSGEASATAAQIKGSELKPLILESQIEAVDSSNGLPQFWPMAMRQCSALELESGEHVCTSRDWQILDYLKEISVRHWSPPPEDPEQAGLADDEEQEADTEVDDSEELGFALEFRFAPNEFLDHEVPPTLYCYAQGEVSLTCPPVWRQDANPTVVLKRKKVKRKGKPAEIVSSPQPTHSFFRLFNEPSIEDDQASDAAGLVSVSELHEQLVLPIAEELMPNATIYYMRALLESDDNEPTESAAS
uniref:Nucleosome assembly protein n=1 Tax=Coccolithus braarudii TaxID=221442 RepID=A0A7S0LSD8_9EUKA